MFEQMKKFILKYKYPLVMIGGVIMASIGPGRPIVGEAIRIIALGVGYIKPTINKILNNYGAIIQKASKKYDVPPQIITSVIFKESMGYPRALGDNGKAYGLMQITAHLHYKGDPKDLFKPEINIDVGTKILSNAYKKFKNWGLAIASFNAGEGGVERAIKKCGVRDWQSLVERKCFPHKYGEKGEFIYDANAYVRSILGKKGILEKVEEVMKERGMV